MLHYNSRHVHSINMSIFRRTNCIITASGIVTLCKRLYSMPDENRPCRDEQLVHVLSSADVARRLMLIAKRGK